jgi:hypothetical protein
MGIEVDQYRESIGKHYTVARSVIVCFNLLLLHGMKLTLLLILVYFVEQKWRH